MSPPRQARESREPREERGLGGEHVEGRNAVRELLRAQRRRVHEIWLASGRDAESIDEIVELARGAKVNVRSVTTEQLKEHARTDAPQGVVARAEPVVPADVDQLLAAPDAFLVAVDGVTDPGNLGAVLRCAETAGVTGVVIPRHRAARLSPAAVKAAAGAVEYVSIAAVSGVPTFLERARRAELWCVGLDADGTADVFTLEVADAPLVLVLGAEGRGLSKLARQRCDVVARIALHGTIESLNVAAAAAVACHAVASLRQRGHG